MSCEQIFLEELKKKGYRFTPQREIVLEIMHHLDQPATAEEIFGDVTVNLSREQIDALAQPSLVGAVRVPDV